MAIPEWLRQKTEHGAQSREHGKAKERFLDKTLGHVVAFTEDTMFNETTSSKNGFLQSVEPGLKFLTIMFFIILLSLQKSILAIAVFSLVSLALALISRIPMLLFMQRILPAFFFTFLISLPATLNVIVPGEPFANLYSFSKLYSIGGLTIPREIYITKQGLLSALTLLLRVTASVSLVFLLTLTTPPNKFIKAVSSFMPGTFKSIVSMSYRYIFFLVRKVEQFIMGFKSRNISATSYGVTGRKWVASRMGLLFSISLKLSAELEQAMESRGYRHENFKFEISDLRFSKADVLWIIFSVIFTGAIIWKSLM
ncbi:MAG: energy-coupling factor transporter transmembrane component T [Thermodesulfovibrionales bacterium]